MFWIKIDYFIDFFIVFYYMIIVIIVVLQIFIPADRRTAAEKTRDLLEQLNEEVELEKRLPDANRDLEERLAKLKGIESKCKANNSGFLC